MAASPRTASPAETAPALSSLRFALLFAGLMVGLLLSEVDQNIFATAMPTIVGELGGVDHMLWVTTPYVLAATVVLPVYGKLGDLWGRRRLFLAAVAVFVAGSLVGGLAGDMGWLIAARTVQGLGGGGLLIGVQAIIADVVPARERARYLSYVSAMFALAAVLGPLLGGWLTEGPGWRWAFWINVPLGALALAAAALFLPADAPPARGVRLDVLGTATLVFGVTCVVLLTTWGGTTYSWSSPVVLGLGIAAVASGVAFVAVERRAASPIIGLHLFADRNFTVPTAAALVTAVAMFGAINYLPTYLQMVTGLSPIRAGMMLLSLIAGLGLATVGSAAVVSRTGRYRELPVVGCALVALALVLLARLEVGAPLAVIGFDLLLLGLGIGCVLQILVVIVQSAAPPAEVGTATAAHNFFREIGVALGSALVGALFTVRLQASLAAQLPGGLPGTLDPDRLTPAALAGLPEQVRSVVVSAYSEALTPVLGYLAPLMVLSAVALLGIRAVPLATTLDGLPESEPLSGR